ncbi:MAG: glycosyltransferase family 4 protein [Nitrospinota bacterium]
MPEGGHPDFQMDCRTVLVVSEQAMYRSGNQVLPQAILAYLRSGFRVILLIRDWKGSEVAKPEELFGKYASDLSVVPFRPLGDSIRDLLEARAGRPQRRNRSDGQSPPVAYASPGEVIPFTSTYNHSRLLSFFGFLACILSGLWRGLRILSRARVDLICGFETHGAPIARVLASLFRLPLVTKYQGTFLGSYLPSRWRMFVHFPAHFIGTWSRSDLVVMEEDGTRGREVLLRLGHHPERIRSWAAGVKKDLRIPGIDRRGVLARLGIPADPEPRVVLTLSKLHAWKRLDRAISAMPAVLKTLPHAYLVLAHRGPERERLEALARRLGVGGRVVFTGPVPHGEVKHLLNSCDVLLSVNDHSNLSNTVLEALACGKPVVSIDDASTVGFLEQGMNALLVPLDRIGEDLPGAIVRVLIDDELRARLGRGARSVAEEKLLSWEERMELEVKEIARLLRRRRPPARVTMGRAAR